MSLGFGMMRCAHHRVSELTDRSVSAHAGEGFTVGRLAHHSHVTVAVVAAGGRIGRHEAGVAQCLVPVSGHVEVSGNDGCWRPPERGQAAVWAAGGQPETRSHSGMSALVIEREGLAACIS